MPHTQPHPAQARRIEVDIAIIGAGTAGMSAYRAACAHSDKVLVIESGDYGTTCARVGCMPSKLLIAAADAAHTIARAEMFGIQANDVHIDGAAVMQRVRSERDRFAGFAVAAVDAWPAAHKLRGQARFIDDHQLQVGDVVVQAKRIIIATGSSPFVPPGWREALGDRLIISDDVFSWQTLPRSLAVVGTGIIGLELAQALHRLGVRVHLMGRGENVAHLSDPALQALARQIMAKELPLTLNIAKFEPQRDGDEVLMRVTLADGSVEEERFDYLLAATGRRPNVSELGLENTSLALDDHGLPTFDRETGQAGNSHIFIAGDVTAEHPLLHEAADDGHIAGDNAGRYPEVKAQARRSALSVVFSAPQMAIVGMSHAALSRSGANFCTGSVSFENQGRSRVIGENQGALHVYGDASNGRFLGAEMIGPAAEHLAHIMAWSVQRGDNVEHMLACPYYHPVIEEGLRTALRDLRKQIKG